MSLIEDLVINRNISVIIKGGYTDDYGSNPGMTVIKSSISIDSGTVEIENISIEQ